MSGPTPADLARLRSLLSERVTLDRAYAEIQAHHERDGGAAISTIEALTTAARVCEGQPSECAP
jgi:hypothetical protein